jgi:hypothetical protein
MSTISGSDGSSSRADEKIRKTREDAKERESEIVKKHHREMRRITEQHVAEVQKMKADHARQLKEFHKESQDTISARDHKYQQEMENMRKIHRSQMQNVSGDATRNVDVTRKVASDEVSQARMRNEARVKDLTNDFARSLKSKEENFQRAITKLREANQKSVQEYRENINRKHSEELDLVQQERQREISEIGAQSNQYRKVTEGRIRDQNLRHQQDRQKSSDDLKDAVARERENQSQNEQILREGFKAGLDRTRMRFEEKMSEERARIDAAQGKTKEQVYERINNQIRTLERKSASLKDQNARDQVRYKNDANTQAQNLREAYQENLEVAQRERDEAVRQGNERNHKDVQKVNQKNSKLMVDMNREFLERMNTQEDIHKNSVDAIEADFQAQQTMTKATADNRVKHIVNETEADKERLAEYFSNNREASSISHREEMLELKHKYEKEKREGIDRIKNTMRKQELEHAEKTASVVAKYEKEIARLNDELVKVRRNNDEDLKRLASEMSRQHKMELDAQQLQYQERLRKTQDLHADELRKTNRVHQERVDQLVTTIKKA